jgi:hypothetical protein
MVSAKRKFWATRLTRRRYYRNDRVVIWRGRFCGESAIVVAAVGKMVTLRFENPPERIRRLVPGGVVRAYVSSCCLIAEEE